MCEGIVPGEIHRHVVASSPPHGRAPAAGAPTAEASSVRSVTRENRPAPAADKILVGNCETAGVDLKKPRAVAAAMNQNTPATDACFPACLEMATPARGNEKEVRIIMERGDEESPETASVSETAPVSERRPRRNSSRRLSVDNQSENEGGGASLDLEDVARGVLSPIDLRATAPAPGSIVVDYDEGMPERSRTGLLLRDQVTAADCAPDACNPLDGLAFDELAIEEATANSATPVRKNGRPRLGSATQPKTPSRRGKSVVLMAPVITPEVKTPLAAVAYAPPVVGVATKKKVTTKHDDVDDKEVTVERCSKLHKLCLCEVRLHKSRESCWLVAFDSVYDVTGLVDVHPAGPRSILRKSGGADCTKDMKFHSKAARKMLEKCFIGKLVACGEHSEEANAPAACTVM